MLCDSCIPHFITVLICLSFKLIDCLGAWRICTFHNLSWWSSFKQSLHTIFPLFLLFLLIFLFQSFILCHNFKIKKFKKNNNKTIPLCHTQSMLKDIFKHIMAPLYINAIVSFVLFFILCRCILIYVLCSQQNLKIKDK
jgi:hypothetical protein